MYDSEQEDRTQQEARVRQLPNASFSTLSAVKVGSVFFLRICTSVRTPPCVPLCLSDCVACGCCFIHITGGHMFL